VSDDAIVVEGLEKSYGSVRALCGVSFAARTGTVFGLLGPNGAGKTTAVRILATLLEPDGGTARVAGLDAVRDAAKLRAKIGLAGQYAAVDENLTGFENLEMVGRLYHMPRDDARSRATDLLERFDLTEAAKRPVKTYSGGMRRRLDLAAALVYRPPVLFLDEPTTGLDPRSRNQVWDIVRVLVADGATVLLTTQYLDEADQLADRIAVIDHGKVIAEGTSAELKRSVGQGAVEMRLADSAQRPQAAAVVEQLLGTEPVLPTDPYSLSARVPEEASGAVARLLPALQDAGIAVPEFSLGQPSLDEVFLTLTGKPLPDDESGAGRAAGVHVPTEEVSR
jgi:ABC-2 type transport system ATP-binding protein